MSRGREVFLVAQGVRELTDVVHAGARQRRAGVKARSVGPEGLGLDAGEERRMLGIFVGS